MVAKKKIQIVKKKTIIRLEIGVFARNMILILLKYFVLPIIDFKVII